MISTQKIQFMIKNVSIHKSREDISIDKMTVEVMQCVLVYRMMPRSRSTLWVLVCRQVASSFHSSSSSGRHRPGCGSGGRGCTATCWGPSSPHTIGHNVCSLGHASNPDGGRKKLSHIYCFCFTFTFIS